MNGKVDLKADKGTRTKLPLLQHCVAKCRSRTFLPEFWFGNLGIGAVLLAGRLLAASVEGWVLYEHLKVTLQEDAYRRAD